MSLRSAVENFKGQLTLAEERLVRELLSNPVEGAFFSTAQLADRTGLHQATAVRLAQKLGYAGYPELRSALRAELIQSEPASRVRRRLEHIDDQTILGALAAGEIAALRKITQHVSQTKLNAAARIIIGARRVFLFAQGHATSLLELMDRRLRRSGFDTLVLNHHGRELAERVLTFRREDTLLAFALHGRPQGLKPLLERSRDLRASSILVSDIIGALVRPAPTIVLAAPRGIDEEFQTLTIPMCICNALVLTIARLDGGQSIETLNRLAGIIDTFDAENPNEKGR